MGSWILDKLTIGNFWDEAQLVDIEDFWCETELASRDIIFFWQNVLLRVFNFVIHDLTWRGRNFIFTEKSQIMPWDLWYCVSWNLPNHKHISVHLISQAFLCVWLEIESNSSNTFEYADKAKKYDNPLVFHRLLFVDN